MAHESAHEGFSLTRRGPLDRAMARLGLAGDGPPHLMLRALLPAAIAWVPLLVLAILRPHEGTQAAISFYEDLATHVRFLIVVPLLVLSDAVIGRRTRLVAAQFVNANLLTHADRPRFNALLRNAGRALESNLAELLVAVLAGTFVWTIVRGLLEDGVTFWFETPVAGDSARLTAAGWWYALGSWLPAFLFLRWAWRYAVWSWLLYQWSRLDLQIVATHPDRAAGLDFVSFGHTTFASLGFAASCLVAGSVGTKVLYEGATLASFQLPLAVFIAISIILGLLPLAVFWRPLWNAKEAGLMEYGAFSSRYVQDFHREWLVEKARKSPFEARDDIGPLCDIGTSFERVIDMRIIPISLKNTLTFAVAGLAPMLPLLLTVMPLKDLLKLLIGSMI